MILKKSFYFVRHGQTDHNVLENQDKLDHPPHIPLNETGRAQAEVIEPIISQLPVHSIWASPMKRVQETKEIITPRLQVPHYQTDDLGECTGKIWRDMSGLGMYTLPPNEGEVRDFMNRIRNGINQALQLPGIPLIVAHGGVHWALCSLMRIEEHEWRITNCGIVHFRVNEEGKWSALKLFLS